MRAILSIAPLALAGVLISAPAFADSHMAAPYLAGDLLSPCQEADNDARWGEAAETECEQYIKGFIGALELIGDTGACPPAVNTEDEVRWAFMRWVHASYTRRTKLSAAEAMMGTLKEVFPCGG
ncbi:Rap1a/Tai family immunity protein [Actibacterium sp. D379-3]